MNRKVSTLLSVVISIALIMGAIWFLFYHQNSFGYGNGQWIMPHHMTIGGGGMGIIMILLWVVVIAAIAIVISGIFSGRSDRPFRVRPSNRNQPDALEILKARYASGEIDKSQYQSMKQELQQHK